MQDLLPGMHRKHGGPSMKKIVLCSLAFWSCTLPISATYQSIPELVHNEHGLDGDQFSNYVYRRYYFVKRLQNTMLLFLDIENRITKHGYQPVQLDGLFTFTDDVSFKDNRVQRSVDVMQKKRSLKPLFMIWEDFTGYKSIKDQIFVEEFTKEVFIISRNMLITLAANDEFVIIPPVRAHATCDMLLDDIDAMTEYIYAIYNNKPRKSVQLKRDVDLHTFAHVDDVLKRFYVIKRLQVACNQLNALPYSAHYLTGKAFSRAWKHAIILSCSRIMAQTESLDPLLELWEDVLQYKYIQDELFMHEFTQLVLCTYADLSAYYAHATQKDPSNTAFELYHLIDTLPLNEILDVIDIIAHDLPPLLEKYEFDSNITWRDWLRKYWWAPPLIVATLAVRILLTIETKYIFTGPTPPPELPPVKPTNQPVSNDQQGDYAWILDNNGFFSQF